MNLIKEIVSKLCDADLNENLKRKLTNISEDLCQEEEMKKQKDFYSPVINTSGSWQSPLRTE
jgi:hypothetical protein